MLHCPKLRCNKTRRRCLFLTGGTHHSVIAEIKDYIAVIEAPLNEQRPLAVLAEAKTLVPDKPVKYVTSAPPPLRSQRSLRTYVGQGSTIVMHESNKDYFEKVFQRPSTVIPDTLGKNPKPAIVQGVTGKYVLTDGKQAHRGLCDRRRQSHRRPIGGLSSGAEDPEDPC